MADRIESILPQPPEVSLLTSAYPFPDEIASFEKWGSQGVQARDLGCMGAYSERTLCADPDRTVFEPGEEQCSSFFPLKTKLPHGEKTGKVDDEARWQEEAEAALAARLPYFVARELWTGAKTGSTSLQSAAEISTSDAQLPVTAIATALSDYEECSEGAKAFIHVPSVLVPYLEAHGFHERRGDRYYTTAGHIIVPGPGYPNRAGAWGPYQDTRPPGPGEDGYDAGSYDADLTAYYASGAEADAGQVWIYVSGIVEVPKPHVLPTQVQRHPLTQAYMVTPAAMTIHRFDGCCVFAALTTIPGNV
mgnify:CR=1 FL=1